MQGTLLELFRRGFQGSAVELSYIYAVIFMRNVTYINEVEGILVHFRLKLRDAAWGIVRSVRLSSDRVVSMIECGHTVGGNVRKKCIYAPIYSRVIVIIAAKIVEVSSAHIGPV